MKKQILTLMACAIFFAPRSGFCMENDKDKPNGPLCILPRKAHLEVLDKLKLTDVVNMKRVSKASYEFLKETKNIILCELWLKCESVWLNACHSLGIQRAGLDLFLMEDIRKSLISLGDFNVPIASVPLYSSGDFRCFPPHTLTKVKKILLLPATLKEGTFLGRLHRQSWCNYRCMFDLPHKRNTQLWSNMWDGYIKFSKNGIDNDPINIFYGSKIVLKIDAYCLPGTNAKMPQLQLNYSLYSSKDYEPTQK